MNENDYLNKQYYEKLMSRKITKYNEKNSKRKFRINDKQKRTVK